MSVFYCNGCDRYRDSDFSGYHVEDKWIMLDGSEVYQPNQYCDECWDEYELNNEDKSDE